jgi:hypothetical protein
MVERKIALIAETKKIRAAELKTVEKALHRRMRRDVAPIWEISASIQSYRKFDAAPADAWPVLVRDDIEQPEALSYHSERDGRPYTMVRYSANWPFLVSHDLLEMLVDPFANRFLPGPDPRPRRRHQRVQYLVEVCDPCAAEANGYEIHGIRMADFCTPDFYRANGKSKARCSFTGAVTRPFEILPDGYITWQEIATGHWWQSLYFDGRVTYRDLGVFVATEAESSVRRRRVSMQMVILRQIQEAYDPVGAQVQSAIEELIQAYGAAH